VWEWIHSNDEAIYGRFSDCYGKEGAGALRAIDKESMEEIRRIFEVSGGRAFYDTIEAHSDRKAREMGYDGATQEYMMETYTLNSENHY
jgi:heterodisulfide reductase subunit C